MLDYSIESPEERNELVKKIISEAPADLLTPKYLEILADYIIFAMDKQERKQKNILTDNRMVTVNKRETSYQGLSAKLENGEDGIFNMIINDKNIILTPKVSITQKDLDEIAALADLHREIEKVEQEFKAATGKRKFALKQQLIQMRKDQYIIKTSYRKPILCMNLKKNFSKVKFEEKICIGENGIPESSGYVSLFDPAHVSFLLCNFKKLKVETYGKFDSDAYFLLLDLENLIDSCFADEPIFMDILWMKIFGKKNSEIRQHLQQEYGVTYAPEYISSLWRKKIPKKIAEAAQNEYLIWYYTEIKRGTWKKCSRCKQIKLAHNRFFSKNSTSKDGFYSICKECRNKKKKA